MSISQLIFGIFFLVLGILAQLRGFVKWWVPIINSLKGVKTEITGTTFLGYRMGGIVLILIGLLLIGSTLYYQIYISPLYRKAIEGL